MSGRRAAWNAVDQALSSATNFGVAVIAARSLSPENFGAFGVATLIYVVAMGTSRGLSTEALMIRFSAADGEQHRPAARAATGSAVMVGGAAGLLVATTALAVPSPLREALWALSLFLPVLLLQDAWRFVFFSSAKPAAAAANDAIWAVTQAGFIALVFHMGWRTPATLIAAWAAAAGVAACCGLLQAAVLPAPLHAISWWRTHRDLAVPSATEYLGTTGLMQATVFTLTGVLGLAGVAALRGAQTLLGPVNMLLLAAEPFATAEGARTVRQQPSKLRPLLTAQSAALTSIAVIGPIALWNLPDEYGSALLGDTWSAARQVLLPYALLLVARAAASGPYSGLKVLEAVAVSLRIRVAIGVLTLPSGLLGALTGGLTYAALGLALPSVAAVPHWWRRLLQRLQRVETANHTSQDQAQEAALSLP